MMSSELFSLCLELLNFIMLYLSMNFSCVSYLGFISLINSGHYSILKVLSYLYFFLGGLWPLKCYSFYPLTSSVYSLFLYLFLLFPHIIHKFSLQWYLTWYLIHPLNLLLFTLFVIVFKTTTLRNNLHTKMSVSKYIAWPALTNVSMFSPPPHPPTPSLTSVSPPSVPGTSHRCLLSVLID